MWEYDIIKRNKCVITIGATQKSGLSMIAKDAKNPETPPKKHMDAADVVDEPVYESTNYQAGEVRVPCYFLKPPTFSFNSEFSEANDLVSSMLGGVGDALHTANLALPAVNGLNDRTDDAMAFGKNAYDAIRQSYSSDMGISKERFNADKRMAVIDALKGLGGIAKEAGSTETRTFRTGKVLDWKGSSPVEFTLEVLFCKPNDGVHMGVLYPIIEAASFSEIAFGSYMYGPRGYNSAGFGIGAIDRILNGEFKSLHSLTLWYSAAEDFKFAREKTKTIILDLFRLLVITSLQIEKSEQLFFNPVIAAQPAPLYKWIKATIGFKTACPIPGTLWQVKQTGMRPNGKSNASLHDFYGSVDAPYDVNYANPIGEAAVPVEGMATHGRSDMTRLTGLGNVVEVNDEDVKLIAGIQGSMP